MPPVVYLSQFVKHRFIKEIQLTDQRERKTDQGKEKLLNLTKWSESLGLTLSSEFTTSY